MFLTFQANSKASGKMATKQFPELNHLNMFAVYIFFLLFHRTIEMQSSAVNV